MSSPFTRGCLLLLAWSVAAGGEAYKPKPVPSDGPRRESDDVEATVAYNRRTLVEIYKTQGDRDPAWDNRAIKFLENLGRRFAGDKNAAKLPDLEADARACQALGCDDTLVNYGLGFTLVNQGIWDKAEPVVELTMARFMADKSLPFSRKMSDPGRMATLRIQRSGGRDAKTDALLRQTLAWTGQALRDGSFRDDEDFVCFSIVKGIMVAWQERGYRPDEVWPGLLKELGPADGKHAWLVHLFTGHYEEQRAGETRIGGSSPDEALKYGWGISNAALQRAVQAYVAAHKLRPERPEAAERLIALARYGQTRETPRYWFDRAVEAEFDRVDAYREYVRSLKPDELLPFADACMATGRYDTDIPTIAIDCMRNLALRMNPPTDFFKDPEMYARVKKCLTGIMEAPGTFEPQRWRTLLLAAAHWAGDEETVKIQAEHLRSWYPHFLKFTWPFEVDPATLVREHGLPVTRFDDQRGPELDVVVRYANPVATNVALVGDFNHWNPSTTPMTRDEDGVWSATLQLRPYQYVYQFLVDGAFINDPLSKAWGGSEDNRHSGSLLDVRPAAPSAPTTDTGEIIAPMIDGETGRQIGE